MSRINTNVTALTSARILNTNNQRMNKSLERLSTGLRINRGSDDPAGLIASENIRKQIKGVDSAIKNAERASNIVSTAEGSLIEVSSMLLDLQGSLSEAANTGGMSQEEIDANQLQVDSILNTIERIANSAEFEGMKLLNGDLAYRDDASATNFEDVTVNAAKLIDGAAMTVDVDITTSAERATLGVPSGDATESTTIQIGSNRGTTQLTFANGTTQAQMESAINAVTEITGVFASTNHSIYSTDYGTDAYVEVEVLNGGAGTGFTSTTDYGVDIEATVNGVAATGDGRTLKVRTGMLDVEVTATDAGMTAGGDSFSISSGGADFALGANVDAIGLESIGIPNIAPGQLGNDVDGRLNTIKSGNTNALTSDNLYTAQRIVTSAIKEISTLRARLGSFQKNTLDSTVNSLQVTKENLAAADSAIRDTDFATETSKMTRNQILVQSATSVLAKANYAPQNVLSLLQ